MDNEKEVKTGVDSLLERELESIKAATFDIDAVIAESEGTPIEEEVEEEVEEPVVEEKTLAEKERELTAEIDDPTQYRGKVLELADLRKLLTYSQLINAIRCGLLVVTVNSDLYSILEPWPGSMFSTMTAFNNTNKLDFVSYVKAVEKYKETNMVENSLQYIRENVTAEEVKEYFK